MTRVRFLCHVWIWLVTISVNRIFSSNVQVPQHGPNGVRTGPNALPQQDIVLAPVENQNDDQAINDWCNLKHIPDRQVCLNQLHQWCDNGNDSVRFLSICKSFRNVTLSSEVPHVIQATGTPVASTMLAPSHNTSQTSLHPSSSPQMSPHHVSPPKKATQVKRPKKAQKQALSNLKGKLNEKQQTKFNKEKLASPMMNEPTLFRRYQDNRVETNELDVNDPENYFHGDVDLTEEQLKSIEDTVDRENQQNRLKRKVGKPPSFHLWDSFPISYQFDESVPDATRTIIDKAIELWQDNTCVRWQKGGVNEDKVEFVNGDGCSSFVGKAGGVQEISIRTPGCNRVGIASHEIGHSLGFFHEQSRPDQQQNVKVNYPNIQFLRYNNFMPMNLKDVNYYDLPYDYGSVMHYDGLTKGFTYNADEYSIITSDPSYQHTIGQRKGPSFVDFRQVNTAYCSNKCNDKLGCLHNGYENPNNCSECKCPTGFGGRLCETVQSSSPGCGEVFLAEKFQQTFHSPSFPDNYTLNQECNWLIVAPFDGGNIHLSFVDSFSFPCDETCADSYVEVKSDGDFQRVGPRFCCDNFPQGQPFISKSSVMVVMFRSYGGSGKGFAAKYWYEGGDGLQVSKPATVAPLTTTTTDRFTEPNILFPKTTPTNPPGCQCEEWGAWDQCTQSCGGCGNIKRSRRCNRNNCYGIEKRHCNYEKCPPGNSFLLNNGEFHLLAFGCCFGLLSNNAGQCTGLASVWNEWLVQASNTG